MVMRLSNLSGKTVNNVISSIYIRCETLGSFILVTKLVVFNTVAQLSIQGFQFRQNHKGLKESPSKIPLLMRISLEMRFFSP